MKPKVTTFSGKCRKRMHISIRKMVVCALLQAGRSCKTGPIKENACGYSLLKNFLKKNLHN